MDMNILILITVLIISNVLADEDINKNTTAITYDPGELLTKIFSPNLQARQAGYGLIKFEDQVAPPFDTNDQGQYGLTFDRDQTNRWKFDDNQNYGSNNLNSEYDNQNFGLNDQNPGIDSPNSTPVKFQDDNLVEGQNQDPGNIKKKRRRRRRRLRYPAIPGYSGPQYPGIPGLPGHFGGQQGTAPNPYVNPGYYRPPHQRPSLASSALSTITEALTSIALYDDYQCVPRLLCEAAGGGSLGSGFLQSAAGLQPLLTLLSAYNGISSSPLFVFGRAVFLGMTSKTNPGTCRYAYPQCPTDPEQLVNYLNNHNGGFFRFFNAPQQETQNLEQFYNQLSVDQNYGLYQPNIQNQVPNGYGFQKPNLYGNQQNYGSDYPYQYGLANNVRFKSEDSKIEKRIQNKPNDNLIDDDFDDVEHNSKWLFPDNVISFENKHKDQFREFENVPNENTRGSRGLKFPDDNFGGTNFGLIRNDLNRKNKSVHFPGDRNPSYGNTFNYHTTTPTHDYIFDYKHNFYVKKEKRDEDEGIKTIYVVRGNGDPNNPEIIKIRPGQTYPYN